MQFLYASQPTPRSTATPQSVIVAARPPADALDGKADACGWFDSSFDLCTGLVVTEQDSDLDYQLCKLC